MPAQADLPNLVAVFVANTTQSVPESSYAALAAAIEDLLSAGREAWPRIEIAPEVFVAHLAERVPEEGNPVESVKTIHRDLYLACACLHWDAHAIEELDELFVVEVDSAMAALREPPSAAEEIRQLVRHKLLVPEEAGDRPAKISTYGGLAALGTWLRVVATRSALSLRRKHKREVRLDEDVLAVMPSPSPTPELDYLKEKYAGDFGVAFRQALGSLTSRQRNLLRLYYVDGLKLDQIGAIYKVHESTVSRWQAQARALLFEETKRLLDERLDLPASQVGSIARLVESQLDVSLGALLNDSD